jgi:hypothetical protein
MERGGGGEVSQKLSQCFWSIFSRFSKNSTFFRNIYENTPSLIHKTAGINRSSYVGWVNTPYPITKLKYPLNTKKGTTVRLCPVLLP